MNRKQPDETTLDNGKLKVRYKVHVVQRQRRAQLVEGEAPPEPEIPSEPQGTIPRIARLLALAHHIQELVDTGQVRDLAEVARLRRGGGLPQFEGLSPPLPKVDSGHLA